MWSFLMGFLKINMLENSIYIVPIYCHSLGLSVFLLVQKNAEKLQNLRLIGYSPARISLPYQLLTIGINALVLVLAFAIVFWLRSLYLERLWQVFPTLSEGAVNNTILVGFALFVLVSYFNCLAIRRKIKFL